MVDNVNMTPLSGQFDDPHAPTRGWNLPVKAIVLIAILFLFWWARHIVILAFAGFLLAIFFQTLAMAIERYSHLRYRWSLAVTIISVAVFIGLLSWLVGARVSQQFTLLQQDLPTSFNRAWSQFQGTTLGQMLAHYPSQSGQSLFSKEVIEKAAGITGYVFQFFADLIIVIFVGLYGAAQFSWYSKGLLHLVPLPRRARAVQIFQETLQAVRRWLLGQLFAMMIVGILTGFGLWIIGVKLPLALGLLAFLLEIVPYLGPFYHCFPPSCWLGLTIPGRRSG